MCVGQLAALSLSSFKGFSPFRVNFQLHNSVYPLGEVFFCYCLLNECSRHGRVQGEGESIQIVDFAKFVCSPISLIFSVFTSVVGWRMGVRWR